MGKGVDCSADTFRRFREWLEPRMPVVFVSDNPAYDFQWISFSAGATSVRIRSDIPVDASPTSTPGLWAIFEALRSGSACVEQSTITIRYTTRSGMPRRSFESSMVNDDRPPSYRPPSAFSTSASVIIMVIGSTGEAEKPAFS